MCSSDLPVAFRTVLEWRLDPASPDRIPKATGYDLQVIVVCRQGDSSSLPVTSGPVDVPS